MCKIRFILPALTSLVALSACNSAEPGKSPEAVAETDTKAPASSPSSPSQKPSAASSTMTRWHYDEQRRAAIYDTAAGEPLFWVACKGSPASRSLYIMATGKNVPAGEAILHMGLRYKEVTMPVASVDAPGGKRSWSGEVPLTSDVAKFLESNDPRAQFRLTINDKDMRMVPNDPAIGQAIAACHV